jgi:hypothetical protein
MLTESDASAHRPLTCRAIDHRSRPPPKRTIGVNEDKKTPASSAGTGGTAAARQSTGVLMPIQPESFCATTGPIAIAMAATSAP